MYDIAIIGAGPAGGSAAIFTAKAGKQTIVFDDGDGETQYAWLRNHYGIVDIDGPDLVDTGKEQAAKLGATIVNVHVRGLSKQEDGFHIVTDDGEYTASCVILATGSAIHLAKQTGLDTKPATEPSLTEIIATDVEGRTTVKGIWAAGMIAGASPHTIITAGHGAQVAVNLLSELSGKRHVDHDVYTA